MIKFRLILVLLLSLLVGNLPSVLLATAQEQPRPSFEGQIAYIGADGNVWVLRGDASQPIQVTNDASSQAQYVSPRWSPDGSRLAFCLVGQSGSRLFIAWSGEWLPFQIAENVFCKSSPLENLAWSPDGLILYFARQFAYNPQGGGKVWDPYYGIWQVNTISGEMKETVPPIGENPLVYPDLSPNGKWLRFYELIYIEGLGVLHTWNTETESLANWLNLGSNLFPGLSSWSPDGSQIVFDQVTYAGFPGAGLFVSAPDGSALHKIFSHIQVAAREPLWSPDGANIAFLMNPISREVVGNRLSLIDPSGNNRRQIYQSKAQLAPLDWSPDGKQLIFGEGEAQQIKLMLFDQSNNSVTEITRLGDWQADWGPLPTSQISSTALPVDLLLDFPYQDGLALFISPDYAAALSNPVTGRQVSLTRPMTVAGFYASPSGRSLVYGNRWLMMDFRDGGKLAVHTVSLPVAPKQGTFVWTSDENQLAYEGQDNHVWIINRDGKTAQVPQASTSPQWSRDGSWLSYCTVDESLWIVGSTSLPKRVAETKYCQHSWSTEQNLLAFTSKSKGTPQVVVYDPEKDHLQTLNEAAYLDSWSPDGRYLALKRPDSQGYAVFAVDLSGTQQLFVGRLNERALGLTGWLQNEEGYFFGPYHLTGDLNSATKVADVLFGASSDGKGLLVGIGQSNLITIACLRPETGEQSRLITFDLNQTPQDKTPGIWAQLSPDGNWALAQGYNAEGMVAGLYRCDGSQQISLPKGELTGKGGFSADNRWFAYHILGAEGKGEVILQDLVNNATQRLAALAHSPLFFVQPSQPTIPKTFLAGGRLTTADGAPLAGISIMVDGTPTTLSGEDGNFVLSGLRSGKHTIAPQSSEYSFSPQKRQITVPPDALGVDFTGNLLAAEIPLSQPTTMPVQTIEAPASDESSNPTNWIESLRSYLPDEWALWATSSPVIVVGILVVVGMLGFVILGALLYWLLRQPTKRKPAGVGGATEGVQQPLSTSPVLAKQMIPQLGAGMAPGMVLSEESAASVEPTQPVRLTKPQPEEGQTQPVDTLQGLLQQGINQVKGTEIAQGMAKLRRVVKEQPDNANAWLWLGWAAAQQRDVRTAERCFRRALKLGHPKAAQALNWISTK